MAVDPFTLRYLENLAVAFLDFVEALGRPLLAAERRVWRWILIAYRAKSRKSSFGKLNPDAYEYHQQLIASLSVTLSPAPSPSRPLVQPLSLDRLEQISAAFLDLCESLGRSLLPCERYKTMWLLDAFEEANIRAVSEILNDDAMAKLTERMGAIRALLRPDPAKRERLKRKRPEMVGEVNAGNYSRHSSPFSGVSPVRMSADEATERVAFVGRLAKDMAIVANELSLVRNADREESRAITRMARRLARMGEAFAVRCEAKPGIPAEKSIDEVMADMDRMAELMRTPASGET